MRDQEMITSSSRDVRQFIVSLVQDLQQYSTDLKVICTVLMLSDSCTVFSHRRSGIYVAARLSVFVRQVR